MHHSGHQDPQASSLSEDNNYYTSSIGGAASKEIPLSMLQFGQDFGMDAPDGPNSEATFIVQTFSKDILKLKIDLESEVPCFEEETLFTMQHLCIKIQSALLSGKDVVIGLSSNLRLYINGHLFSNECTSFLLT